MMSRKRSNLAATAGILGLAVTLVACDPSTATQPLPELTLDDASEQANDEGAASDTAAVPDTATADSPGDTTTADPEPLPAEQIETLFSSSQSGIEDEGHEVVETAEAWEAAWAALNAHVAPVPSTPDVDFAADRVVLVTAGTRPNGGHRLELVGVTEGEAGLTVNVHDIAPGPGCLVTQQITQPALAIAVPRVGETVTVSAERVYSECD